jgi:hypothetical protein
MDAEAPMSPRVSLRIAPVVAMIAVSAGCAAVLGLDAGVGDDPDSGEAADVLDGPAPDRGGNVGEGSTVAGDSGDAGRDAVPVVDAADATGTASDSAQPTDRAADDVCACAPVPNGTVNCTPTGGCGHVCDQGYVDCAGSPCSCGAGLRCLSDQTCAACRATLQPCQLGTDCCSGNCGPTSTCL